MAVSRVQNAEGHPGSTSISQDSKVKWQHTTIGINVAGGHPRTQTHWNHRTNPIRPCHLHDALCASDHGWFTPRAVWIRFQCGTALIVPVADLDARMRSETLKIYNFAWPVPRHAGAWAWPLKRGSPKEQNWWISLGVIAGAASHRVQWIEPKLPWDSHHNSAVHEPFEWTKVGFRSPNWCFSK